MKIIILATKTQICNACVEEIACILPLFKILWKFLDVNVQMLTL